jgi:hypothetical protein
MDCRSQTTCLHVGEAVITPPATRGRNPAAVAADAGWPYALYEYASIIKLQAACYFEQLQLGH